MLRAGDTLRYTITVKNIGNANATDAAIRDQIPANTTYVAGSTTLNGAGVADNGGLSPLVDRHGDLRAGGSDARPPARRCVGDDEQRRHDHVRRARRSRHRRRHGDLQPGVRERRRPAASSTIRPTIRIRRSRTIRRATSSASCRCCSPTSARRCRSTTARRASSIRATSCATRSRSTTRARSQRRTSRCATRCRRTRPTSRTRRR